MKASPTSRTLAQLKAEGWTAEKVEQRLPIPGKYVTRDLFGFVDIVAIKPGTGILGVQATSGPNVASRVAKIRSLPAAASWLESGAALEVWGWRKAGARGERKTWQVRRLTMTLDSGAIAAVGLECEQESCSS